jgi:MtaA/CmuA family methyltransferase
MTAVDPATGKRLGRIDVLGGGGLIRDHPIFPVESLDDLKKIPRPHSEELLAFRPFISLRQAVEKAKKRFFVASSPGPFTVNYVSERRGREQALMDLVTEPGLAKKIMDVGLEIAIEKAKALVKCGVDALYIGDPSASASLISPTQFKEFCLSRFRTFCDELHKYGVLIYLHICGNASPIREMMADTGADCLEPLDPLGGVSVADAKRRVGHRVALMGGVNTLTLLNGSPAAVYEEALGCCRAGGADGGYILAAGDMVPDFTPEENVRSLVQAAKDYCYR